MSLYSQRSVEVNGAFERRRKVNSLPDCQELFSNEAISQLLHLDALLTVRKTTLASPSKAPKKPQRSAKSISTETETVDELAEDLPKPLLEIPHVARCSPKRSSRPCSATVVSQGLRPSSAAQRIGRSPSPLVARRPAGGLRALVSQAEQLQGTCTLRLRSFTSTTNPRFDSAAPIAIGRLFKGNSFKGSTCKRTRDPNLCIHSTRYTKGSS